MSQPEIEPRPSRCKMSTLTKSYSNSMLIHFRNICIWARNMAPPSAWGCMNNIYEHTWAALRCTCKSFILEFWHQALASRVIHCQARYVDHVRVTIGETWLRSSPSSTRGPETDMSRTSAVGGEHSNKELFEQLLIEHLHMSRRQTFGFLFSCNKNKGAVIHAFFCCRWILVHPPPLISLYSQHVFLSSLSHGRFSLSETGKDCAYFSKRQTKKPLLNLF
jgi:hypothetical protein